MGNNLKPILHPHYREIQFWPQLGYLGGSNTSFWLFWGPFWAPWAWFSLSQRWRLNLWGKPQNISERYEWSGGVISNYLSLSFFQEQLRKLNFGEHWDFYNLFTFNILSGWPCMSTQTSFLRILSRKQISCDLRVFGVNFELEFYLCEKIDIMQLAQEPGTFTFFQHFWQLMTIFKSFKFFWEF